MLEGTEVECRCFLENDENLIAALMKDARFF
jgi:hypothetical protein